jgi:hypothetical protein
VTNNQFLTNFFLDEFLGVDFNVLLVLAGLKAIQVFEKFGKIF